MKGASNITWVIDFIAQIPQLLLYVVPGYVTLYVYRYIRYQDRKSSEQVSYLLFNSIILSFILRCIFASVYPRSVVFEPFVSDEVVICLIILGVVVGFLWAKFVPSCVARCIRSKLGISRTSHDNIWDDILEPGIWLRAWVPNSGCSYVGQIKFVENFERKPIIVLTRYQYLNDDAEPVVDHSHDLGKSVMLNLEDFERIELTASTQQQ